MRRNTTNWKKNALLVLGLCALAAVLAPSSHAADHRLRVSVNESFEIDGQVYEPGVLILRHVGQYNPNETLNELWVGKHSLGLVVARSYETEGVAEDNSMLFARNRQGRLVLVGVSFRGEPAMALHRVGAAPGSAPAGAAGALVAGNR